MYTKIDLRGSYNLVGIRKGNEWMMMFRICYNHFKYLVNIFQRLMNDVFCEYLNDFMVCYINDILIFSKNMEDYKHHVRLVLEKLHEVELYAKLK